jgi:hypothetical protein
MGAELKGLVALVIFYSQLLFNKSIIFQIAAVILHQKI